MSARDPFVEMIEEPGLRRCAITLHALNPSDRTWLLERLPPARRAAAEHLVEELRTLGIAADPRLVDLALADSPPDERAAPASTHSTDSSLTDMLKETLRREPPSLVACVLSECDEPCRTIVLAGLSVGMQAQVRAHLDRLAEDASTKMPAALSAAIRKELARHHANASRGMAASPGAPSAAVTPHRRFATVAETLEMTLRRVGVMR